MAVQTGGPGYKNPADASYDIIVTSQNFFVAPYGWAETTSGTGAVTQGPMSAVLTSGGTMDGRAAMNCSANGLTFGGTYYYIDWDLPLTIEFTVARLTSNADSTFYVQLKQDNAFGALADDGIGIYIENLRIYGESFGSALMNGDTGITMVSGQPYRVQIRHRPGVGVEYWINGTLSRTNVLAADIPSGDSTATCYLCIGCHNNATATEVKLIMSGIKIWQAMP